MSRDRPNELVLEISELIQSQTEFETTFPVHIGICPICLDTKMLVKWSESDLEHQCCQPCRIQFIADLVTKGWWEIGCFMPGCREKLRPERVSDELRQFQPYLVGKWETAMTRRYLLGAQDVIWCPGPNCNIATINVDIEGCQSIKCPCCATVVCPKCKGQLHLGTECVPFPTLNGVKLCPTCGVHIERIEGCPAMICTICGQKFCWTCGQPSEYYHDHNQPQHVVVANEQIVTEVTIDDQLVYNWPINPFIKWPLHIILLLLMPVAVFIYISLFLFPICCIYECWKEFRVDKSLGFKVCGMAIGIIFAFGFSIAFIWLSTIWAVCIAIDAFIKCLSYRSACVFVESIVRGHYL